MGEVSLEMVYDELLEMRKDLRILRTASFPDETVNQDDQTELDTISVEMKQGKRIKFDTIDRN
ncbi:MAG: hypothetical protein PHF57_05880 [Methanoregula sp.]|jgi:hypothetical protein|nr:hypothetical protein [Methanoregula sp.]MDD5187718.1 hypothetical protein [Methanoregula sp.]